MKLTHRRLLAPLALVAAAVLTLSACGSSDDAGSTTSAGATAAGSEPAGSSAPAGEEVAVTLITKDSTNPFWLAMKDGAEQAATANNVALTFAFGKQDGDEQGQVEAIEQAIARGDKGILIASNGPAVNTAIAKARDSGMYVIALDTPTDPADAVDITFATDNFLAGQLGGQWMAGTLDGQKAVIAMLPAFTDKVVSVDVQRYQGFLDGMGIDIGTEGQKGSEAPTGKYTGGKGGDYEIVCSEPGGGNADDSKTAMETCVSKSDDINVVYTINEPTGAGAHQALEAAGIEATIVSVDGGCEGVKLVKDGVLGATSQQYPLKMAEQGVAAVAQIARGGEKPTTSDGLDFFNTGVALVTDNPVDGVDSIDTTQGAALCWGAK